MEAGPTPPPVPTSVPPSGVTILLRDLELYAYHGVPAEERVIGHRYRVSGEFELSSCGATASDDVQETVDYGQLAALLADEVRGHQFQTLERLAAILADRIFATFPLVQSLSLTVEKPLPPAPVIAASLGVRFRAIRP